jgi:hypothetical protein
MRPVGDDALAAVPIEVNGVETPLSAAIDSQGWLYLLIPVDGEPAGTKPADLNGLRIRHRCLESGEVLELSAPPSHERVFTPFCSEIVDAVAVQQRDPWKAVAATVRAWQSAWKPARQAMDKITQVGLFGELLVLRRLMIPALGPAAVDQWSGPDQERHDFVGDVLRLEVKTTRKSRAEHEISRLDQLHVPAGCQLLFVSIQVEETIGGAETVATELDAIIEDVRHDAAALDLLMSKMVEVDWSDEMRDSGELMRFNLRNAGIYVVDDAFPRLPEGFRPPSGVVAMKYTIDLANLPTLDIDEATALIQQSNVSVMA